jgi:hypothetical protein
VTNEEKKNILLLIFFRSRLRSPSLRRSPSTQRAAQSTNKFEELFYFEATLLDGKVNGQISAGIGICEEGFPADTFIGWRYDA